MTRILTTLLIVSTGFMLSRCDGDNGIPLDIPFDATIVQVLPVAVATTNEMSTSVLLDASSNNDFNQYASNIKSIEITELLFAVENYQEPSEDEIYFTGDLGFGSKSSSSPSVRCSLDFYNITHVANTGDSEISTCNDKLADIATLIFNENAVKVYMVGKFTKAPFSFDLKVTAKIKVVANPL